MSYNPSIYRPIYLSTTHCQKIIFLFEAAGRRENKNVFESDRGIRGKGDRDTGKEENKWVKNGRGGKSREE